MPLATTAAQNAALDAVVGTFPDDGTYRLYDASLVELTSDGGYAPADHSLTDWAASNAGTKTTAAPVSFGTSTDAYSDVAYYWGVADSSGALVYYDLLPEQIAVGAAGTGVGFSPVLFYRSDV